MTTRKIYLVQEPPPGLNILPAARFGELQPPMLERLRQVMFNGPAVVQDMWHHLRGYRADALGGDFILAVGDFVAVGIAIALAAKASGGRVRVLKWDRQERDYYVVDLDLSKVKG